MRADSTVKFANGLPAPAAPPRTPGSLALKVNWEDAISTWDKNKAATDPANNEGVTSFLFILVSS